MCASQLKLRRWEKIGYLECHIQGSISVKHTIEAGKKMKLKQRTPATLTNLKKHNVLYLRLEILYFQRKESANLNGRKCNDSLCNDMKSEIF